MKICAFDPLVDMSADEREKEDRKRAAPGCGNGYDEPAVIAARPYIWNDPKTIPPRQFLYGTHYVRKFVSATIAPGGLGKSAEDIAEAVAMIAGKPLLGHMPANPLNVWYWNLEDPADEIERRIAAVRLHYQLDPKQFGGKLFVNSGRDDPLTIAEKVKDVTTVFKPVVDGIIAEIRKHKIDVLIIDPFVSCHRAPENDNNAIDAVSKAWALVANDGNCAVELVHHVRKTPGAEHTVDDARGASALISAVRSARVLNVMTGEEADAAGVTGHRRRSYFHIDNGKANFAPPPEKAEWRKFVSVELGNGDSVGAVTPWQMPSAFDGMTAADLLKVQKKIAEGEWRENVQSAEWAGKAVAEVLGLDLSEPKARADIKTMLQTWIKNGVLKVSIRRALDRKERKFIEVGQWAT
jgi:AAA domain